jgi:Uma2 family endonuclease
MATAENVTELEDRDWLCELIDGVLVQKAPDFYACVVQTLLGSYILGFVDERDLGNVVSAAATMEILPGQVRIPDVSFIRWDHFPHRTIPRAPIPRLAPDLAVEVLCSGNTKQEIERKLRDYSEAGVSLVWYIDADDQTARAYTSPERYEAIPAGGVLDGGNVLPGFHLSLAELFARAGKRE